MSDVKRKVASSKFVRKDHRLCRFKYLEAIGNAFFGISCFIEVKPERLVRKNGERGHILKFLKEV